MKDPEAFIAVLQDKHHFKLNGSGPIPFHLGLRLWTWQQGHSMHVTSRGRWATSESLCTDIWLQTQGRRYVSHQEEWPPWAWWLNVFGFRGYSTVDSLQWAVSWGRFDITTGVMILSGLRVIACQGHLKSAKQMVGHWAKMQSAKIWFCVAEPDYSNLPIPNYNWAHLVYVYVIKVFPADTPKPLGKPVISTSYVDANLYHNMSTGRCVTGILHLLNQIVSARACVE